MRTNIKVVGIGQRISGTSKKTNKDYDFTPISIIFPDGRTAGYRAETVNVNAGELPAGLAVNSEHDTVMHYSNNQLYIDAFL